MIERITDWTRTPWGTAVSLFTLKNEFLQVRLTDVGAALVSLETPDRWGNWRNITVSAPQADYYLSNPSYLGATVGRFANRIGRGEFWLEGKRYQLATNNGSNHLHGGLRGFTHAHWHAEPTEQSVTFRLLSPDGDEGYPGNLNTSVTYTLNQNELLIQYSARSDAPTVINLTNHTYWNLAGGGSILDHQLELWSDLYLEADADVLPTGRMLDVANTPFEFRYSHRIGDFIDQIPPGYDHCFLIRNWNSTLLLAAKVIDFSSGRVMEVHTTTPGVQLYTANHFDRSEQSAGFGQHEAFCLECQHFPDSPNQPEFPATALRPGEEYRQATAYRFFTQ
ncbi:aldose epimerase family protein [Planctomicrobium sp. SH664]|uniref:aldose epimerase family protein n=1 Tax=Planctomicrobium sp. SH664 TaxID=3448125 RepID=UPI003F5CA652